MLVAASPAALQSSLPFSLQSVMSSMQSPRWICLRSWCLKHFSWSVQSSFDLHVCFLGKSQFDDGASDNEGGNFWEGKKGVGVESD